MYMMLGFSKLYISGENSSFFISMNEQFTRYFSLFAALCGTIILSRFSEKLFLFFNKSNDAHLLVAFFSISLLFVLSFVVSHTSKKSIFPSFVTAIFFGVVAKPLLAPIVGSKEMLSVLVGVGATLILFGGGIETPFASFKKLILKITSLSFIGLGLTAFLFSSSLQYIGGMFGTGVPVGVAVLLGAILASTDPAAIIPILKQLRFKNPETKDIIVSESAVTDVTGTLLTLAFLGILATGGMLTGVNEIYRQIFSSNTGHLLVEEILFGIVFGVIGYGLLSFLTKFTKQNEEESEADAAFFLFVPIMIFTFAVTLGGSGYLAAFVAGLLFVMGKNLHHTEEFFNHIVEGFMKPTIFVLLGALVDIGSLLDFAGVGIVAAFVFMFIIRPFAVMASLGPFYFFKKQKMGIREILFISFIRETGAIPAVLLVTVISLGIPGLDGLIQIGMWVILITLIVEPPLTPYVARKLKVADVIGGDLPLDLDKGGEPYVVIGSRGRSFLRRLPKVADWAIAHGINRVVVLHCPEDKYSEESEVKIKKEAQGIFDQIEVQCSIAGSKAIDLEYVSRKGFLQDNIIELSKERTCITALFVGKRVLDFRLEQVKELQMPIFFLD